LASLTANNSERFTEQQFYLQCKTKTAEIVRQQKSTRIQKVIPNVSRVSSDLTNGVGNDLKHRLRSSNEVYGVCWTAVDETAGVASTVQPAV
jgi:hypothetical protein